MTEKDIYDMNILKGKRVKLTVKSSSYLGVLQRIRPHGALILADVVNENNGCRFHGTKVFYGNEITNVEILHETNSVTGPEDPLDKEKFQSYRKTITMDHGEDEEEHINFVVIDEFHEKFGPAVMHIKKQPVIGVGSDGVEVFKYGRLCWLQIATEKKVYLFDILLLGARAFKNGLSMILGSKDILKVIHDCRAITGYLLTQYGVKLTNVFDTQVADVMCFHSETGGFLPDRVSTLQEVVSLHLKVPSTQLLSLQMKSQLTKEEKEIWYRRPCPVPLLEMMALSVVHLHPLRLVLMDTLMMDYIALVDSYLNSSHYEPGELEHITMESMLELPSELRQLQQMHRKHREWAANHYPVTEHGLLARFNPRSKSPPQTSPAPEEENQAEEDSSVPVAAESPLPSPQLDQLPDKAPTRPPEVTSVSPVDIDVSSDPPAQALVAATVSDFGKQMPPVSPLSLGVGRGSRGLMLDTIGRGMAFGRGCTTLSALPGIGRGFLHQITSAQIPGESNWAMESSVKMETSPSCISLSPSQKAMPQVGTSAGADTTPRLLSSSLSQSFRSFRH